MPSSNNLDQIRAVQLALINSLLSIIIQMKVATPNPKNGLTWAEIETLLNQLKEQI